MDDKTYDYTNWKEWISTTTNINTEHYTVERQIKTRGIDWGNLLLHFLICATSVFLKNIWLLLLLFFIGKVSVEKTIKEIEKH